MEFTRWLLGYSNILHPETHESNYFPNLIFTCIRTQYVSGITTTGTLKNTTLLISRNILLFLILGEEKILHILIFYKNWKIQQKRAIFLYIFSTDAIGRDKWSDVTDRPCSYLLSSLKGQIICIDFRDNFSAR